MWCAILAPTLFLIFVNDLHFRMTPYTLSQYADDTSVIVSASSVEEVSHALRDVVGRMSRWCDEWGLVLNGNKTHILQPSITSRSLSLYVPFAGRSLLSALQSISWD